MSKQTVIGDVAITSTDSKIGSNGKLFVFQSDEQFSFKPERVFTVHADQGAKRGSHAHRKCWQAICCLQGSCLVRYRDGHDTAENTLYEPNQVIVVPPGIWVEQDYLQDGTIIMVFCDQPYDEGDYIRSWEGYLHWRAIASS